MQTLQPPSSATRLPASSKPVVEDWIIRLFGSRSPLGFEAGDENLYRYVGNNPTNATDPSGTTPALARIDLMIAPLMLAQASRIVGHLPQEIYNQIVEAAGHRAEEAVADLALRQEIRQHYNGTRTAIRVPLSNSFTNGAPNALAVGLGIPARHINAAIDAATRLLRPPAFTGVTITLTARVTYTLSTNAGPVTNGNVRWIVRFTLSITATDAAGRAVQDNIPFRTRTGSFYDGDIVGLRPG